MNTWIAFLHKRRITTGLVKKWMISGWIEGEIAHLFTSPAPAGKERE